MVASNINTSRICLKKTLGWDPSQYAYLCRHNLIGIRRARELEAEGWSSLSLSALFPWRSIHSSNIHLGLTQYPIHARLSGEQEDSRSQLIILQTHVSETHSFAKNRTQTSFKAIFKTSMRLQSTHVKELGLFIRQLHKVPDIHLAHGQH